MRRSRHHITAVFAALALAALALPGAAAAMPIDPVGPAPSTSAQPAAPAETVVRTVVREEAVRVLPIVLSGAALLVALAGTGYVLLRVSPARRPLRAQH
jgi:hypothetical protein